MVPPGTLTVTPEEKADIDNVEFFLFIQRSLPWDSIDKMLSKLTLLVIETLILLFAI